MDHFKYYHTHLNKYKTSVKHLYKQMATLSVLRLFVFVLAGFCIYFFFGNWPIAVSLAILGLVIFLYLLSKHTAIKRQRDFNKALVTINEEEIKIVNGDFHDRDTGLEFQDPNHFYSLDIDLFGHGSFFQCINRTSINEGTGLLAHVLKANNVHDIEKRQNAIKELGAKIEWRQHYSANAKLIHVETPAKHIVNWLKQHNIFLPKVMAWFPLVFSVMTIILFLVTVLGLVSNQALIGYWLFVGLGVTGFYVKKINNLASNSSKLRDTFRQYAALLDLIEKETFTSSLLVEKQKLIQSGDQQASTIFTSFSKSLDALDNRNNLIGAIFGNGYFLTNIKNSYKIERWIDAYRTKASDWFEVVAFFDAYNTLGNYAYNQPSFTFPKIVNNGAIIKAEGLGHPLLSKEKRVTSNLFIDNEQFFIITGANMAGKSTFLRTVSLHIVMANVGLPICAKTSIYSPVKLITSMRTTDSLTDDSSYFFSELTRLKYIVNAIQKESYFIILDEILKGTNSTDKAIGSRKFVEKLVASKATGIIATHDLSLCEISNALQQVKNYYFDAEIVNDELHFDYTLKTGICKNMNASFLLKKMEII